jgi:uncharacterized protein DUF4440
MKFKVILLTIFLSVASLAGQQSKVAAPAKTSNDKKLEHEIKTAEARLGKAIRKRDTVALEKLLADYYADSHEGSERAIGKQRTIANLKSGLLRYYQIHEGQKFSVSAEIMQIEGVSKFQEANRQSEVYVTRLWTRKDGRWQLIAQTLRPLNEEAEQ